MDALLNPAFLGVMIPIIALMIPIVAIVGALWYQAHQTRLTHDTIRLLAEKGQPIPPQLFTHCGRTFGSAGDEKRSPAGALRRGIITTATGIGLTLMLYFMRPDDWLWAVGLIPLFIGLGHLLVWKLQGKTPE